MAIRLVALDIDGTVVEPGAMLPTSVLRDAVRGLQSRGVVVVLASGRMYPGTKVIADALGVRTPLICQQGCAVHAPDGALRHEFSLDASLARELVEYSRSIGAPYEWFNPLRYLASRETDTTRRYAGLSAVEPEYVPAPEDAGVRPTGVGIITSRSRAQDVHRDVVRRHGDLLHALDFPEVTVAVAPGANKGHALSLLCADLGIERGETLAIGDSVNDAAMLAWAGRGVAMPKSDGYAVDAADEQLDDEPDALAGILDQIGR